MTISQAFRQLMETFSEVVGEKIDEWDGGPQGNELEPEELLYEVVMMTVGPAKCLEWAVNWGHGSGEEIYDQLTQHASFDPDRAQDLIERIRDIDLNAGPHYKVTGGV